MDDSTIADHSMTLGRRDFLRCVGAGGAAIGLVPTIRGSDETSGDVQRAQETIAHYPGARYFAGSWRLRLDKDNQGKGQEWYRQEPTDSVSKAYQVGVPGCWQEYVPGLAGGIGWYFKEFELPTDLKGQVLRLKFWAVDYFAEVWVNGEKVGEHAGGYTPFEVEITRVARLGNRNRLAVRVVDPPRPLRQSLLGLPGWEGTTDGIVDGIKFTEIAHGHQSWQEGFNFGGIWQPVELLATDPLYISDVFIEPNWGQGTLTAHVEITSHEGEEVDGEVRVVVHPWKDSGEVAGESAQSAQFLPGSAKLLDIHVPLQAPHAWSPADPFLYVAEVSVQAGHSVRHQTTARFGLREFTVKDGYFHLNGKRIFVKSGHHQGTYPTTLESPPTREFAYEEVRIFKEAGFNFCRLWLKPTPAPFLDAADELGLMLQEEPPLSLMQDSPQMLERSQQEVREMVRRDRNRPSIVIWNMINENDPPVKYVRQQCQAAREVDPTRLITESAGGPSKYYLPYSQQEISYLTEHPYPGAPLAEDLLDYQQTRGMEGQLCFFSEYGYGGMNDLESVLAKYGPHARRHMEEYAGHVLLKERREKVWAESSLLRQTFGDPRTWLEACQTLQADAVRLHTEAMRANPVCGGYNYVQVFDSNAIELDGLVDFWRDKRKKAFYAMQQVNRPLLLVICTRPMNCRLGEEVRLRITLVNEEQIAGPARLRVRISSPEGKEVYVKQAEVEVQPWVSTIFEERVRVPGESGRYVVEAVLAQGEKEVVRKEDWFTVFDAAKCRWPSSQVRVWDVDGKLEPYYKERAIEPDRWTGHTDKPVVIVVTPTSELWRKPDEYRRLIRLLSWVERGCTALFLGVPSEGGSMVTAAPIGRVTVLTPLYVGSLFPFRDMDSSAESWTGLRVYAYAWGLTDTRSGAPIPRHPVFEGIPQTGLMGREYGNVAPVERIETGWRVNEDTGSTVQIYDVGRGKLILTSLNLLPNLRGDALAEQLLANLVNFATRGLPASLGPQEAYTDESESFATQNYEDCFRKYVKPQA